MIQKLVAFVLLLVLPFLLAAEEKETKGTLPGDTIPGPFQVLGIVGGRPGKYYCPVCEFGLDPVALVFARNLEDPGQSFSGLLQRLNEVQVKHSDGRLKSCVVFLSDAGYRDSLETPVNEKDKAVNYKIAQAAKGKEEAGQKVKKLAEAGKLENVALALASPDGPADYKLPKDAAVVVLLYDHYKVIANHTFKHKLDDPGVDSIMKDVEATVKKMEEQARRRR